MESLLNKAQEQVVLELSTWVKDFVSLTASESSVPSSDNEVTQRAKTAFVGYSDDTAACIVVQVSSWQANATGAWDHVKVLKAAKDRLILSATPDAVIRVKSSGLSKDYKPICETYFTDQDHSSLDAFLRCEIAKSDQGDLFFQITTHYKLLSQRGIDYVKDKLSDCKFHVITALQAIDTEVQFVKEVRAFLHGSDSYDRGVSIDSSNLQKSKASILMVQCEAGHDHTELIACARYIINREYDDIVLGNDVTPQRTTGSQVPEQAETSADQVFPRFIVVLLIQLKFEADVRGFHGGRWICAHIDDLRCQKSLLPGIMEAKDKTVGKLLEDAICFPKTSGDSTDQFHVYDLLERCMYEALVLLTTEDQAKSGCCADGSTEATNRLSLLFKLFSRDCEFREKFAQYLVALLVHLDPANSEVDWLCKEAADFPNVRKNLTFRRSFEDSIKKRIVPVFAAMVAYIDSNSNLSLMCENDLDRAWVKSLWLTMFKRVEFQQRMIHEISDVIAKPGFEVPIKNRTSTGHHITPKFPFSWTLKAELDEVLGSSKDVAKGKRLEALASRLFSDWDPTFIGNRDEAVAAYAHDLLAMSFNWPSDDDDVNEIVYEFLSPATAQGKQHNLGLVHWEFSRHFSRYQNMHELLCLMEKKVRQEVLAKLRELYRNCSLIETSEIIALDHLLNDLTPSVPNDVTEWRSKVHLCYPIVQDLLLYRPQDEKPNSIIDDTLQHYRYRWNAVVAACLFLDYANGQPGSMVFDEGLLGDLFRQMKSGFDLTLDTFMKFEDILLKCRHKAVQITSGADVRLIIGRIQQVFMHLLSDIVFADHRNQLSKDIVVHLLRHYVLWPLPWQSDDPIANPTFLANKVVASSFILYWLLRTLNSTTLAHHMRTVSSRCPIRFTDMCEEFYAEQLNTKADTGELECISATLDWTEKCSPALQLCKNEPDEIRKELFDVAELHAVLAHCARNINKSVCSQSHSSFPQSVSIEDVVIPFCRHAWEKSGCPHPWKYLTKQIFNINGVARAAEVLHKRLPKSAEQVPNDPFVLVGLVSFVDPYIFGWGTEKAATSSYYSCRGALRDTQAIKCMENWYKDCKTQAVVKNVVVLLAFSAAFAFAREQKACLTHLREQIFSQLEGTQFLQMNMELLDKLTQQEFSDNDKEVIGRLILKPFNDQLYTMLHLLIRRLWATLLLFSKEKPNLLSPLCVLLSDLESKQLPIVLAMLQDTASNSQSATRQDRSLAESQPKTTESKYSQQGKGNGSTILAETALPSSNVPQNLKNDYTFGQVDHRATWTTVTHAVNPELTPLGCMIELALLHMTLYSSALQNGLEKMTSFVYPREYAAGTASVVDFLEHICNDLRLLGNLLDKPVEDCLILLHTVVCHMLHRGTMQPFNWSDEHNCREWKKKFQSHVIAPAVQEWSETDHRKAIIDDQDLFGPGRTDPWSTIAESCCSPRMWEDRVGTATVASFAADFEVALCTATAGGGRGTGSQNLAGCRTLMSVLRHRAQLVALQYLPGVVSLAVRLHRDHGGRFSETVLDVGANQFKDRYCKDALDHDFTAFVEAWNAVHLELASHSFWYGGNKRQLPEHMCSEKLTDKSKMRSFMFTGRDDGLKPLALATYLAEVQNRILEAYSQSSHNDKLPKEVSLADIRQIHIIMLAPEKDLLPRIMCHKSHFSQSGNESDAAYDFEGIEVDIAGAFVRHKRPLLLPNEKSEEASLPRFYFHQRFVTAKHIAKLKKGSQVPQVFLTDDLARSIRYALGGKVADLTDALNYVEKVATFFASTQTSEVRNLGCYIENVLHMKLDSAQELVKQVLEKCDVNHVRDIWLLLSMELSMAYKKHDQPIVTQRCFEGISKAYTEAGMSAGVESDLVKVLTENRSHLPWLLRILHDFIVLKLSTVEEREDQSKQEFKPDDALFPALMTAHTDDDTCFGEAFCHSSDHEALKELAELCKQVLLKHSAKAWHKLYEISRDL